MILFAGGLEHLEDAKEYINRHNLTKENVRLIRGSDYVHVVTRNGKPLWQNTLSNQESLKKRQN
jgi:hypothetical protein